MSVNENSEEISQENLVIFLKEKNKENKVLKTKLSLIEEKYVKIFKENKNLHKDKKSFEIILDLIFKDYQKNFEIKELGQYNSEELKENWDKMQREKTESFNNIMNNINKENNELEEKYNNLLKNKIKQENNLETNKELLKDIKDLENSNVKLMKEIVELNDIIAKNREEIIKFQKIEEEFSLFKAQLLLNEFDENNNKNKSIDLVNEIKRSNEKNELILAKNELEAANLKISQLKKQLGQVTQDEKVQKEINEEVKLVKKVMTFASVSTQVEKIENENEVILYKVTTLFLFAKFKI